MLSRPNHWNLLIYCSCSVSEFCHALISLSNVLKISLVGLIGAFPLHPDMFLCMVSWWFFTPNYLQIIFQGDTRQKTGWGFKRVLELPNKNHQLHNWKTPSSKGCRVYLVETCLFFWVMRPQVLLGVLSWPLPSAWKISTFWLQWTATSRWHSKHQWFGNFDLIFFRPGVVPATRKIKHWK